MTIHRTDTETYEIKRARKIRISPKVKVGKHSNRLQLDLTIQKQWHDEFFEKCARFWRRNIRNDYSYSSVYRSLILIPGQIHQIDIHRLCRIPTFISLGSNSIKNYSEIDRNETSKKIMLCVECTVGSFTSENWRSEKLMQKEKSLPKTKHVCGRYCSSLWTDFSEPLKVQMRLVSISLWKYTSKMISWMFSTWDCYWDSPLSNHGEEMIAMTLPPGFSSLMVLCSYCHQTANVRCVLILSKSNFSFKSQTENCSPCMMYKLAALFYIANHKNDIN